MTQYQANLYPAGIPNPTVTNAEADRKNIAVCFSGGGSRALTCAWGQMIGLYGRRGTNGRRLLDDVRYISSVSGGSWASVLYTFHPGKLSDDVFLGSAYPPDKLYYGQAVAGGLDVKTMGVSSLGKIPQNFANLFELDPFDNIFAEFIAIMLLKDIPLKESAKWLWMYIVGKNVLADFDLYTYSTSLLKPHDTPWNYAGAKYFSLSESYAKAKIFSAREAPSAGSFVYARSFPNGRPACPMLVVNTNVIGKERPGAIMSGPLQIPVQVSPVAAGIYGENPLVRDGIGGGSVESFGFTSHLASPPSQRTVLAEFPRAYALVDITACSSAFYAAFLAEPIQSALANMRKMDDQRLKTHLGRFLGRGAKLVMREVRDRLDALHEESMAFGVEDFVPEYDYWPVGAVSKGAAANRDTLFTDGGDLENTGVAGLLAQVQSSVRNIIAFVNGSEALEKKDGRVIAATQMAPLFGVAYNEKQGQFKDYLPGGINPFTRKTDPAGFLQVFDNASREFEALRQGLYAANGGGTSPAFFRQKLRLVSNTLLGIQPSSDTINLLWVQNATVGQWQSQIADSDLRERIEDGQRKGGIVEFADFPYYSTFLKIHQSAAETNTLAQMWAWCVGDNASPLSKAIADMFEAAGK